MSYKKHEVIFDAARLYHENYTILKSFGGGQKQVLCGCGTTFFTNHYDKKIECPTCKAEGALQEAVELLAKYALENSVEKAVEPIIMTLATRLVEYDLHEEEEFPNLSKYWKRV